MAKVKGYIGKEAYKTIIEKRQHVIISDEPESLGGKDEGMSPTDLLGASLVSCSCITMRMYAERKGWEIEKIAVEVDVRIDIKSGETTIEKLVSIDGDITDDDRSRLFKIASACPVHKLLAKSATITSTLIHEE